MTVVRECDSHQGGVKCIRNVCLVLWRGAMVMWKVLKGVERCDSCQYIEG